MLGILIMALATCHRDGKPADPVQSAGEAVILAETELDELSGLAGSTINSRVLWGINDSGNASRLFAFDKHTGADLGNVEVSGVVNVDWEDMASFVLDGQHWLLIADIGDNDAVRQLVHLWLVPEPLADAQGRYAGSVRPAADIAYRYPLGARDAESAGVDVTGREIIIISKRDPMPRIYTLPISTVSPAAVLEARFVGELTQLEQPDWLMRVRLGERAKWRSQPTAMDIQSLPDGRQRLVLLTHMQAYLFDKQPQQSWQAALQGEPGILPIPELRQPEALAFDQHLTSHYWLTSERLPTPLHKLPLPAPNTAGAR